jgi:hypothetical protein
MQTSELQKFKPALNSLSNKTGCNLVMITHYGLYQGIQEVYQ